MDGNQNMQGNQQNSSTGSGQGGSQFGAPPPREVNIRSAETDRRSVERGDAAPTPDTVMPPWSQNKEPNFRPETQAAEDFSGEIQSSGSSRRVWLWIFVGVMVIAVGVVGWIVYPLIFGSGNDEPQVILPPPLPPAIPHQSLFVPAPLNSIEIRLTNTTYSTLGNALQALVATPGQENTLQEVAILDGTGSQIPFAKVLSALAPTLTEAQLAPWFEDNFSAFIFYNTQGAWPGYVARIKNGVNIDELKVAIKAFETGDLTRFYLASPGTFSAFKDGQINGKATRYATGSNVGASFNYGVLGNYLVISTSYAGLQNAAPLLGI